MPTNTRSKKATNSSSMKTTGLDETIREINEEDLWTTIIPVTDAWDKVEEDLISSSSPFTDKEVFDENEASIHNRSKLGQRLMGFKGKEIAKPRDWETLFTDSFNKEGSFYDSPIASVMRGFAVCLALSSPKTTFDSNLWKDGRLQNNLVTSGWIGAY